MSVAAGAASQAPFNRRTVFWGICASLLAAAGFFLLSTYAPDFKIGAGGGTSTLSKSGTGFAGLARLLALTGEAPLLVRREADLESDALLIVTVPGEASNAAVDQMVERRQGRSTLFVLPKWQTIPLPGRAGWEMGSGRLPAEVIERLLGRLSPQKLGKGASTIARIDFAGVQVTVPDELQWASAPFPDIAAGPGQAVLIRGKDTAHYVLTDPDFLDNAALKDAEKAAAALALVDMLRAYDDSIMLDLTLYGAGRGYDLGKLLVEPPFLALTLTILAAGALAFLHGLGRFGPPLPQARAIPFGKSALVNTTAMLLRRAGRLDGLGPRYAALMRGRAAQLLGAPQGLQGEALDRWLDSRDKDAAHGFTRRAEAAQLARNEHDMQAAARQLYDWIARRQGEHR
jgi:hypothetical protein